MFNPIVAIFLRLNIRLSSRDWVAAVSETTNSKIKGKWSIDDRQRNMKMIIFQPNKFIRLFWLEQTQI